MYNICNLSKENKITIVIVVILRCCSLVTFLVQYLSWKSTCLCIKLMRFLIQMYSFKSKLVFLWCLKGDLCLVLPYFALLKKHVLEPDLGITYYRGKWARHNCSFNLHHSVIDPSASRCS